MKNCTKCASLLEENTKFCGECGQDVKDSNSNQATDGKENKKQLRHWLLWWKIDESEIKRQVDGYTTLSITESARGQSVLCLLLSAAVTFIFIISGSEIIDNSAYTDIVLFCIFAFFIYRGQRWAIIGAMIFWTIEKVYFLYISTGNPIVQIIWWAVYMSAFWLAFKTEIARSKK